MQIAKTFIQSLLATLGAAWLVFGAYYGLNDVAPESRIGFFWFLALCLMLGVVWFCVNGFLLDGYLRRSITITSNAFDMPVKVLFGDLFAQDGWKAISVNEYFDSAVDGDHVSERSLHGAMLKQYWGGNLRDWDEQIADDLKDVQPDEVRIDRPAPGKANRYAIGTTATASTIGNRFLCVAAARTDTETLQASASLDDLNKAFRGLLCKARSVCSGHALSIPLMGSGLSRTGIKPNILVVLILLAVFEESKQRKITSEIRIVLPKPMRKLIDLPTIQKDWK